MRLETYRKAPEHIQAIYGAPETGELLGMLQEEYKIPDDTFIEIVGDVMLGFYPKAELRKLLISMLGVSEEAALAIEQDLQKLLSGVAGAPSVPPAPRDVKEPVTFRPTTPPMPVPSDNSKPLTREEVLRSIAPKRTMAQDIESLKRERKEGVPGNSN